MPPTCLPHKLECLGQYSSIAEAMMSMWSSLSSHWSSLTPAEIFSALYLLLLILAVITSNHFFIRFVSSKPEGRKTVLGLHKSLLDSLTTFPQQRSI